MSSSEVEWTFGHVAGICDVAYVGSGDRARLLTCGADGAVHVRSLATMEVEKSFTEDHADAVNALAVAPGGETFATASDDACVKTFDATRGFESNATRFTLPARAVAYSPDGASLAAGGEDSVVRVISVADGSVARELPVKGKCVKSLAFDPAGDYLCAVDDAGALLVWALRTIPSDDDNKASADDDDGTDEGVEGAAAYEPGDVAHYATVAPVILPDAPATNAARWRPDGALLAVPGRERDVTFFRRGSWTELEEHRLMPAASEPNASNVALLEWSPNGVYLLACDAGGGCAVWDAARRVVVARLARNDAQTCGAAWRPDGNELALVDATGQWAVWKNPVPAGMPSPVARADAAALDFFKTSDDDKRTSAAIEDGEVDDDADEDASDASDASDAGEMDEEEYYAEMERRGRMKREAAKAAKAARAASLSLASPAPQPAFQVASVPPAAPAAEKGAPSRRFLCYNALGSIVSASEPGSDFNSVEMAFHDTSRAGRVPTITDYHGYDVGTLGERGCALASPGSKEGGAATLFYRPYESWAHGAEWRASLPAGEKAVSVACGVDWVACVTNRRRLRVFSAHGAQRQCVALDGAPVTLAGSGALLTVAWHAASPSVRDGVVEQRLEYAEYDLTDGGAARVGGGRLPVAPGATLTWLGRCEDGTGALAFGASDGTVSVRTNDFGGSWTPAFSSREAKKRADERHWIVSVAARDADGAAAGVYCVVCRADAPGPNVHPRPVLTPLPLSFPVALPEASSGELEENAARARLAATLVEAAARNAETTLGADEDGWAAARAGADAAADKAALRLFHAACKGERPARAADIAASLRLSNSLDGALRLANALHQPALARRVTDLIEASMAAQAARERHEHYAYAHPEPSQLATPGQAGPYPSQEPSSRAAPAEEANPFARRAANASKENERQKPEEEKADDRSAAVKTKAGFEANATTPAKKSRAANPFARK